MAKLNFPQLLGINVFNQPHYKLIRKAIHHFMQATAFFAFTVLAVSSLVFSSSALAITLAKEETLNVWFSARGEGIYHAKFSGETGALSKPLAVETNITSDYIVRHPTLPLLYSIGKEDGVNVISAHKYASDGKLTRHSMLSGRPAGGTHININKQGSLLAVAYYGSANVGIYSLNNAGKISGVVAEIKREGKSIHPKRQRQAHPHWVGFAEAQRGEEQFLYVTDLGSDHVAVYTVNIDKKTVKLKHQVAMQKGSGPRHLAFHPNNKFAYISDELSRSVSVYAHDPANAALTLIESQIASPEAKAELWANVSDIRVHPTGKFLYVVNRGFDQVSVFQIDANSGRLSPVEREPIRGSISRNMVVTEDGQWAMVAGTKSHTVAVFKVNQTDGSLQFLRNHLYTVPHARSIVLGLSAKP